MRISDWRSDVCASDLPLGGERSAAGGTSSSNPISGTLAGSVGWPSGYAAACKAAYAGPPSAHPPCPVLLTRIVGDRPSRNFSRCCQNLSQATSAGVVNGRAHVCTPVTNAQLLCRSFLETKKNTP